MPVVSMRSGAGTLAGDAPVSFWAIALLENVAVRAIASIEDLGMVFFVCEG